MGKLRYIVRVGSLNSLGGFRNARTLSAQPLGPFHGGQLVSLFSSGVFCVGRFHLGRIVVERLLQEREGVCRLCRLLALTHDNGVLLSLLSSHYPIYGISIRAGRTYYFLREKGKGRARLKESNLPRNYVSL